MNSIKYDIIAFKARICMAKFKNYGGIYERFSGFHEEQIKPY